MAAGGATMVVGAAPAWLPDRKRAISSGGRTVADRPMRCAGVASMASRRSSDSARCAPRLVPATACTSSTMTVCTVASVSRAADVSIRNSDSGVVMRMSGGLVINSRRRLGGVSPDRTPTLMSGGGWLRRSGDPGDARQRCAQVPLDVDGQRLERGDVEHPGPRRGGFRGPPGGTGQPVHGPQKRGQCLARPGRGDDQRVVAVGDGRPGLCLRGCGLHEGAREPLPRQRAEAVQRIRRGIGGSGHPTMVPRPTDKVAYVGRCPG